MAGVTRRTRPNRDRGHGPGSAPRYGGATGQFLPVAERRRAGGIFSDRVKRSARLLRPSATAVTRWGMEMIGKSMLGRVIAVALVFGASTPLMAQDYGRDRGHEEDDEEVRRVGRRGREDGVSKSEEAQ